MVRHAVDLLPEPDEPDADGDGCSVCLDCDDGNNAVFPGNTETTCDGLDNDCDPGTLDEPDANGNGVPDDCECPVLDSPQADGIAGKNRYLSFATGAAGRTQAVRVTFVSMPGAHAALNGTVWWVGPPADVSELGGSNDATLTRWRLYDEVFRAGR